ncbi:hypothetical protein Aduo_003340 [Ancylostoma duodenale]
MDDMVANDLCNGKTVDSILEALPVYVQKQMSITQLSDILGKYGDLSDCLKQKGSSISAVFKKFAIATKAGFGKTLTELVKEATCDEIRCVAQHASTMLNVEAVKPKFNSVKACGL